MPVWVRGEERAEIVAPFPQQLAVTALGNSGATPARGHRGRGGRLRQPRRARGGARRGGARQDRLRQPRHDGRPRTARATAISARSRRHGPVDRRAARARRRSSSARSAPTITATRIPASRSGPRACGRSRPARCRIPDAEQLQRILEARQAGDDAARPDAAQHRRAASRATSSPKCRAAIPAPASSLIGGHLDSWDLGTGAIDNAAGVAITAAAAKRIMAGGPAAADDPGRLVRRRGGRRRSAATPISTRHTSDGMSSSSANPISAPTGSGGSTSASRRPTRRSPTGSPPLLAPLGIVARPRPRPMPAPTSAPGPTAGVAAIDLNQDGTRYFDYHHTPDDTLDKVDPAQLRQNVAAWTAMLAVVAERAGADRRGVRSRTPGNTDETRSSSGDGRGDRIRTCDPLLPKQMRYQAALLPAVALRASAGRARLTAYFPQHLPACQP